MNGEKIAQHISEFRMQMLENMPFYGDIVMDLDFIEDNTVPTACTDGIKVLYNSDFLSTKSECEINYILMHEVMHIVLDHPARGQGVAQNKEVFNIAADIVVNSILDGLKDAFSCVHIAFARPDDAITDRYASSRNVFSNNLENIYNEILTQTQKRYDKVGSILIIPERYGNTEELNSRQSRSIYVGENPNFNDLFEKPLAENDEYGCPAKDKIKEILIRAKENDKKGRGMGMSVPVPEILLEIVQKPPLNWKKILKDLLNEVEDDETSYATPERKYLHMDLILPGHGSNKEEIGDVWAFVDTSGSIGKDELNLFISELYNILKQFNNKLHIAYWDTSVTEVYKDIKTKADLLKARPHSSGGTDINCVHQWIQENKIKPEILLILTDGYFGRLRDNLKNGALKQKTIVVLSTNLSNMENIEEVGKIAVL